MDRRQFFHGSASLLSLLFVPVCALGEKVRTLETIVHPDRFPTLPSPDVHITFDAPQWTDADNGLQFARVPIYQKGKHVDTVAILDVDPAQYTLKVAHSNGKELLTAEEWQARSGGVAVINAAQYMGEKQYGVPVAPMRADGVSIGPKINQAVRGMILAQPLREGLPEIDFLDVEYDRKKFGLKPAQRKDGKSTWMTDHVTIASARSYWGSYQNMIQHWGILLDREGRIRMGKSSWQANRTVTAMSKNGHFLIFNTEGGFFTLHNFGRWLQIANSYLNVKTAMNMDGGYEADLVIRTPHLQYTSYGRFETQGPGKNYSWPEGQKVIIPGVLCVVRR